MTKGNEVTAVGPGPVSRNRGLLLALLAACGAVLACSSSKDAETATLVLRNGKVATMELGSSNATAVAIRGDRIVAVGKDSEMTSWIGDDTQVIDVEGRLVIPGFIEGHGHFFGLGESKLQLDLRQAENWGQIVDLVAQAVANSQPGAWIEGRGWHQSKWNEVPENSVEGLPIHDALSAVSPNNPVVLEHASGHSSFVNARALQLAGIGTNTSDPAGGQIIRDRRNRPTGALRETAQSLVTAVMPAQADGNRARRVVQLAGEECLREGVTSFQDAGSPFSLVDLYREMANEGSLPVRLWVMIRDDNAKMAENLAAYRVSKPPNDFFSVGGIKKSIDGALGSHGAWLLAPYADLPGTSGLNITPISEIESAADLAIEHGLQLCVHAIGDRANRETLDLMKRAFDRHGISGADRRWRIEHAQHLNEADIPRFAELGVIASMQGVHCTSDGPWVPDRIGDERAERGAYVWRKLLDSGVVISNGTDTPVEAISPLASFAASVTRLMTNGKVFYGDQRMTRQEALRSYTINAAFAAFQEADKGSIRAGKLADLVVLSHDILTVPAEELPQARVVMTILGGEVRYQAEAR